MTVTEETFTTDLREQLLKAVRVLARGPVALRAAEIDHQHQFPEDIRALFAEAGLFGLTVPRRYGGLGVPLNLVVDTIIEIARVCANSANLVTQQALAIAPLLVGGSEAQKQLWLPPLAAGEQLASFALTEPDAGSDNRSLSTIAERDGDRYLVSGGKVFCTWGSVASLLTVFAKTRNEPDGDGVVALVVELPAPGYTVNRIEEKMGLNGSPTAQVTFDRVSVPLANRLGGVGEGLRIALRALDWGRVEIGALAVGVGQGALEFAGRHLDNRKQFGQPLSSFQGLQFRIADHSTGLEAAYRLLLAAAEALDAGRSDATRLAAMAKLFATDTAMAVTSDAVGLLGGYGYMKDYPVERMMRDVKVTQIVEGTNEIQRIVIAREWFRELRKAGL